MKTIILAGGGGTRLFPVSRKNYPKQFMNIDSDMSLLAQTVNRFQGFVRPEDIVIVTNENYYFLVKDELAKCNAENAHIITVNHVPEIQLLLLPWH